MPGPRPLREPARELRFTRARQALDFALLGVLCGSAAGGLAVLASPQFSIRGHGPVLSSYWPALVALTLAAGAIWVAIHLSRHAYILLTPVGLEIFPFFRPARNFRLVLWQEIEHLEVSGDHRVMAVDLAGGGRIFLSLVPLRERQRELLAHAAAGIVDQRRRHHREEDRGSARPDPEPEAEE